MTSLMLYIVAEGQSERELIVRVIAPYLQSHYEALRIYADVRPVVVITSINHRTGQQHRGGGDWTKWQRTIETQLHVAQRQPRSFVSTLFDLFRLPKNLPFMKDLLAISDGDQRADFFEAELSRLFQTHPPRFIPYIQKYEFEALVFARLSLLAELVEPNQREAITALQAQTAHLAPEDINGGDDTAPSKRLIQALPGYDKLVHGLSVLDNGDATQCVNALCAVCPRFQRWIKQLSALSP